MGIKGLFKHLFHYLILATAVLALSACGGGESSSSGEPRIDRQEAEATNLVFVDAQLARCVEDLIYSKGYTLVEQITELDCSDEEIADVEGIENLFNLQTLDLRNNLITDVAPISQLKNLKQLNLQNNKLEIAAVLTESESLEQIDLTGNNELLCVEQDILNTKYNDNLIKPEACEPEQLTIEQAFADTELLSCVQQTVQQIKAEKEIDILYPQQLQQLECINQNINSIAGIENLVNLRELNLSQNAIDDIGLLQGLTKLKRVLLSKNQITDIQPLISSANMQELRLDGNSLTDTGLGPIQNLKALQLLHISSTDVRDLSLINGLTELLELRANNNRIIDLDSLSQLTKLSSLWVENNQIAKLDTIEQLPNLVHLVISNNWVTDLTPLQNSDKLRWLHLDGTEVQDLIPLSSLTELKWLQLNNSRVEDIQAIYSLNKLDWLHLKGNNSIPCEQLEYMENFLTPERIERPDVESCDQTPQPQSTPISTIEFQDQELRDCVYDAAKEQGAIDTNQLTSLSCSIEEYGEITDITGLELLPELQTINLIEHNDIACTQLDDLRERYSYQGEGYEGEGYEGEYYGEVVLSLPENCNTAPSINAQAEQTVLAGEQTTITAQAIDLDEDELTYSWQQTAGEQEVQLTNANTATPSFTAPQQEQTLEFTLTVTDEHQLSTTQTISIIVTGAILGTKENPFLVETYDDLKKVGSGRDGWELDSYYLQTKDIDAGEYATENDGKGFIPIGTEEKPFTGGYDGGGFAIDGLTINRSEASESDNYPGLGLFGYAVNSDFININLLGLSITVENGNYVVGGVAGYYKSTSNDNAFENISVYGEIAAHFNAYGVGGIAGTVISDDEQIEAGTGLLNVTNSYFIGTISGHVNVGGLVGRTSISAIEVSQSHFGGNIQGNLGTVGGLFGSLVVNHADIKDSYSGGTINVVADYPTRGIGGVAGQIVAVDADISGVYSEMDIIGAPNPSCHSSIGGLFGIANAENSLIMKNSFAKGNIQLDCGNNIGGILGVGGGNDVDISDSYAEVNIKALEGVENGGFAGKLWGATGKVSNIYATGNIHGGLTQIGGLLGILTGNVSVSKSFATGDVISGNDDSGYAEQIGGAIGFLGLGSLDQVYALGNVSGTELVGGLVGLQQRDTLIANSYARGIVNGNSKVGGLVGQMYHSDGSDGNQEGYSSITNSYATGQVLLQDEESEPADIGGLVGASTSELNTVTNSFWDIETSGQEFSAGGIGLPTSQMQTQLTFTDVEWDFENIWRINEPRYPEFIWQPESIQIASYEDLKKIGVDPNYPPNATYIQINDIDASVSLEESTALLTEDMPEEVLEAMGANPQFRGFIPIGLNMLYSPHPIDDQKNMYDYWIESGVLSADSPVLFTGEFDGMNHSITGLYQNGAISVPASGGMGLFYNTSHKISRVELTDVDIYNYSGTVGGIVGMTFDNALIENVIVTGKIDSMSGIDGGVIGLANGGKVTNARVTADISMRTGAGHFIGGITGFSGPETVIAKSIFRGNIKGSAATGGIAGMGSEIYDSSSHGTVTGGSMAGGIVATHSGGKIDGNWSSMDVVAINEAGGIAGNAYQISNCYATGNVSAEAVVGGLVGKVTGSVSEGVGVSNSYSIGIVTQLPLDQLDNDFEHIEAVGGLIGIGYYREIIIDPVINSFWDTDTSGIDYSAGGTGLPTSQMQTKSTFTDVGWNFANRWVMREYPEFQWDSIAIAEIEFVDSALRQCVLDAAQANNWTQSNQVTNLDCSYLEVSDATGLEQLTNISDLNLVGNNNIPCYQLDDLQVDIGESGISRPEECNLPPTISLEEQVVFQGAQVILNAEVDDPNGDSLTYSWQQTGGQTIELANADTAAATFTAPEGEEQTLSFQLTVTDAYGLTATQTVAITVKAQAGNYQLTISKQGNGQGSVSSYPEGIDCGSTCQFEFAADTIVMLTATPDDGSVFNGWSENCTVSENQCQIMLNDAHTVTADFAIQPPQNVMLEAGDSQIRVTWDEVTGATGYTIYWAITAGIDPTNSDTYIGSRILLNGPYYTISLLTNDTEYFIVVTTQIGGTNESAPSAEQSAAPEEYVVKYIPLNDTGIVSCADEETNDLECPQEGFPNQDAEHGRDALAQSGKLTKIGGGDAGFDFTKICNSGEAAGEGDCPAEPVLGSGTNEWACTRDNHTGFMWEVKTDDGGLRDKDNTYSWYNPDPKTNGGDAGTENGGECPDEGNCDTEKYVNIVNAIGLCGHDDWRMPIIAELKSIVNRGRYDPSIDTTFFPNTRSDGYWTALPYVAHDNFAWRIYFNYGDFNIYVKGNGTYVRLVSN